MNTRQFNAQFRPLVDQAWRHHCSESGQHHNSRQAKDRWYREQLFACCKIETTKGATSKQLRHLIAWFGSISPSRSALEIVGWSQSQNAWFSKLADSAYSSAVQSGTVDPFENWISAILEEPGILDFHAPDNVQSFDSVMGTLAVIANDDRAISHFAEAAEIRMRWQLSRFLIDLQWLEKRSVDISYVHAIWRQSGLLQEDIDDAPADQLRKALAMLDTHIRRLCRDYCIKPMDLPTRSHRHNEPVTIGADSKHIHVGSALEHCQTIAVDTE